MKYNEISFRTTNALPVKTGNYRFFGISDSKLYKIFFEAGPLLLDIYIYIYQNTKLGETYLS